MLGARGAEGSQMSSSSGWIPRGGGDRKSSGGFSRQTVDLQLAPRVPGSPVSQRMLGYFSEDPPQPPAPIWRTGALRTAQETLSG